MLKSLLADPTFQETLLELGTALVTAVLALAGRALFALAKAKGIEISEAETKLVLQLKDAGIAYAEEYGRARLKGGEVVGGEEKRKIAIDAVRELAGGRLKKWTDDKIGTAVDAGMQEFRARTSLVPPAPVPTSLSVPTTTMPPVSPDLLAQLRQR